MAYFCLDVLRASTGKRRGRLAAAARRYRISERALNRLTNLTSNKGGAGARKGRRHPPRTHPAREALRGGGCDDHHPKGRGSGSRSGRRSRGDFDVRIPRTRVTPPSLAPARGALAAPGATAIGRGVHRRRYPRRKWARASPGRVHAHRVARIGAPESSTRIDIEAVLAREQHDEFWRPGSVAPDPPHAPVFGPLSRSAAGLLAETSIFCASQRK